MKPKLKPPGSKRLKLHYHKLLSTSAIKPKFRRYTKLAANGVLIDAFSTDAPSLIDGRGSHSLPFQLNLSSFVHRMTHSNHECVLELLKLSCNVDECKPLIDALTMFGNLDAGGTGLHSFTFQLNMSRFQQNIFSTYPLIPPDTF